MDGLQIRFAAPDDATAIAWLFCRSFSPEVAQLLTYGCKGAPEHIRRQVEAGIPNNESVYLVAESPQGVVGAVELRRSPGRHFLNYIAVSPACRGNRVGTTLFLKALKMAGAASGQLALDVLQDNEAALRWYTRLGFQTKSAADFVELATPGATVGPSGFLAGLPQADVCQECFGFSSFSLITADRTFAIGRIGDSWFRLTDRAAAGDPAILGALKLLDPARRVFAILPASSAPASQVVRILARTERMEMEIPALISSLSE
jgi:ribosomal protein S18 acetylase RimI-like enzyme